jgi:copper(I)-binding protein
MFPEPALTRFHLTRFHLSCLPRILSGVVATLILTGAALAHGVTVGGIEVIHPNIPAPAASAHAAAGYMGIANGGPEADRLIGVETPAAQHASLHTTDHGADGVARMIALDGVDIPAGDTVVLEPGGLHVMLMGLTGPLAEGALVPGTLIFERAGRVEIEFMVDPSAGVDHSTMDHGQTTAGN